MFDSKILRDRNNTILMVAVKKSDLSDRLLINLDIKCYSDDESLSFLSSSSVPPRRQTFPFFFLTEKSFYILTRIEGLNENKESDF